MRQIEIAKYLSVSQGHVSRFLSGKSGIKWKNAKKLSELLGKSPAWWMEASPEKKQAFLKELKGRNRKAG